MKRWPSRETLALSIRDRLIEQQLAQVDCAARSGVDAVLISSYWEGADMISPDLWRKYSRPGIQALARRAHERGLSAWNWFLGDCVPVLDDLIDAGIDVLMLEQGRHGYTSDPVAIRKHVGDALCITGWTDELDVINDRRDAIARRTAAQMQAAETGPYMATTTYLTAEAPVETVDFYCREVARLGTLSK